MLKNIKNV